MLLGATLASDKIMPFQSGQSKSDSICIKKSEEFGNNTKKRRREEMSNAETIEVSMA